MAANPRKVTSKHHPASRICLVYYTFYESNVYALRYKVRTHSARLEINHNSYDLLSQYEVGNSVEDKSPQGSAPQITTFTTISQVFGKSLYAQIPNTLTINTLYITPPAHSISQNDLEQDLLRYHSTSPPATPLKIGSLIARKIV